MVQGNKTEYPVISLLNIFGSIIIQHNQLAINLLDTFFVKNYAYMIMKTSEMFHLI